jgi:hypothetical protein
MIIVNADCRGFIIILRHQPAFLETNILAYFDAASGIKKKIFIFIFYQLWDDQFRERIAHPERGLHHVLHPEPNVIKLFTSLI